MERVSRNRSTVRRHYRVLNRRHVRFLPGYKRGPNYVAQALVAFRRAIRAHRRLKRLVPSIFDSAVVERERLRREEQRQWMASWESAIQKAYGTTSSPQPQPEPRVNFHPNTERAVDRELANWKHWFSAGSLALEQHRQRRPHAQMSWSQTASLLDIAFTLKRLACGLDSTEPIPESSSENQNWKADIAGAHGPITAL